MSAHALITIIEDHQQRHFYQRHGPPQLLIPRLARFVGWADAHAVPLTVHAYQAYAAWLDAPHRPGVSPGGLVGFDHRYRLMLREPTRGFDLTVHGRVRRPGGDYWLLAEHLSCRADLHTPRRHARVG